MGRIILYVGIILIGAIIGFKELFSKGIINRLDKIQYVCLLLLLFIMGVKIGINEEILRAFPKLGLSAIIISVLSILFSIVGVRIISKYISSSKKVEKA